MSFDIVGEDPYEVVDISCKSDDAPTEPEVLVDVWQPEANEGTFVRIPVTNVELWVEKGDEIPVRRTAKVEFPIEWGAESVLQYVQGINQPDVTEQEAEEIRQGDLDIGDVSADEIYDIARIWFYDEELDAYVIQHFGYVGGLGPKAQAGEYKMWVYDPADLLKRTRVSQSWGEPTISTVLDWVVRGTDATGRQIGIENNSVFGQVGVKTTITGPTEVANQKLDTKLITNDLSQGPLGIFDAFDDIGDYLFGTDVTNNVFFGEKTFRANKSTVLDVLDWFTDRVGGKWQFEPSPGGPVLVFDNTSAPEPAEDRTASEKPDGEFTRRVFVDESVTFETSIGDFAVLDETLSSFGTVDTLENTALADVKPINELVLYGRESAASVKRGRRKPVNGSGRVFGTTFPVVTIRYDPLIERANGYTYTETAETDAVTLEAAKNEAQKLFKKRFDEETEGSMTLRGEPFVLPYDLLVAVPVCDDTYTSVDATPIWYEVESVKHTRSAGERYTTDVAVSLYLFDGLDQYTTARFQDASEGSLDSPLLVSEEDTETADERGDPELE